MELATIDPHSHKLQTKLDKIIDPKVSMIQPFENVKIDKEIYGHLDTVFIQCLDGQTSEKGKMLRMIIFYSLTLASYNIVQRYIKVQTWL